MQYFNFNNGLVLISTWTKKRRFLYLRSSSSHVRSHANLTFFIVLNIISNLFYYFSFQIYYCLQSLHKLLHWRGLYIRESLSWRGFKFLYCVFWAQHECYLCYWEIWSWVKSFNKSNGNRHFYVFRFNFVIKHIIIVFIDRPHVQIY